MGKPDRRGTVNKGTRKREREREEVKMIAIIHMNIEAEWKDKAENNPCIAKACKCSDTLKMKEI